MREPLSYRATAADYKKEAKDLFNAVLADDESAHWRFKWLHPRFRDQPVSAIRATTLSPGDAQVVIAREYHFEHWAALVQFSEAVAKDGPIARFEEAADAVVDGDAGKLRGMLTGTPDLAHARSARTHGATLLHYIAANGVEDSRQRTPPSAVKIAELLLNSGADPNALADMYGGKSSTMGMLVSSAHPHKAGLQADLARVLFRHGAKLEDDAAGSHSAAVTALVFGYADTAAVLVDLGARVDLVTAAGLGMTEEVRRLLPTAGPAERHAALALAAQLGKLDALRLVLDAGEDPNRYNPPSFHEHATPLHQSVWSDDLDVVKLLVERGARHDVKDKIYDATPLGWAEYGKREEIAQYLRSLHST